MQILKKILLGALAVIMAFSSFACSKKKENTAETQNDTAPAQIEDIDNGYPEAFDDLIGKSRFHISYSDENIDMGDGSTVYITSHGEFAKFASVFKDIPANEYDEIICDDTFKGIVSVSKIPLSSDRSRFMLCEAYRYADVINVTIAEHILDDDPPENERDYAFAYVVFAIPDAEYNDEELRISIVF